MTFRKTNLIVQCIYVILMVNLRQIATWVFLLDLRSTKCKRHIIENPAEIPPWQPSFFGVLSHVSDIKEIKTWFDKQTKIYTVSESSSNSKHFRLRDYGRIFSRSLDIKPQSWSRDTFFFDIKEIAVKIATLNCLENHTKILGI